MLAAVPVPAASQDDGLPVIFERRRKAPKPPWMWDPSSQNYTWPNVHSYCVPCNGFSVGTCFFSSCYGWRGETECMLTRCTCKKGYCPKEDVPKGQEKCVPQVCVGGPRPFPARRGFAVNAFYWMLGERPFPQSLDKSSMEVWHFGMVVGLHALWVPLLGFLSISVTMFGLHYYRSPRVSTRKAVSQNSDSPSHLADHILHLQSLRESEASARSPGCREPRRNFRNRPHIRHLVLVCIASVAICYLGVYIREVNWNNTVDNTYRSIERFKHNAVVLRSQGHKVAKTCDTLSEALQDMNVSCTHDPLMQILSGAANSAFTKYINYVNQLEQFLDKLPGIANDARRSIERHNEFFLYFPLIPVMVVAFLIVVLISEVLVITTYGKLKWALRLALLFHYSSWFFGSLIMFLGLFTYAGFMLAMTLGSFCYEVDANVLNIVRNYVKATNSSNDIYDFAAYYITGVGTMNPVLTFTKKARLYIEEILQVYNQFEGVVQSFYPSCPPLADIRVPTIAKEAREILQACVTLLEPANIYPYYEDIVRDGICSEVMHSFSNFPVFTLLLGLVIFPGCAVAAHRYLVHWSYWKYQQHGLVHNESTSSSGDESDELSSSYTESEEDVTPRKRRRHHNHHHHHHQHRTTHGSKAPQEADALI